MKNIIKYVSLKLLMGKYHLYPITTYNKYLGRSLYKLSRQHLSTSQLLALNAADAPASIVIGGMYYAATSSVIGTLLAIALHQGAMSLALSAAHRTNVAERTNKRKKLREIIIELESLPSPQ